MQSQYENKIINITTYKNLSHAWTYLIVPEICLAVHRSIILLLIPTW
jgi:hypothetical protein